MRCDAVHGGAAEVIQGISPKELQQALVGRTVRRSCRKGKQMWLTFDEGPALMLHLGDLWMSFTPYYAFMHAVAALNMLDCSACTFNSEKLLQLLLAIGHNLPGARQHAGNFAGMTGHVAVRGKESLKYMLAKAVDVNEWPPKYAKVQLSLSEGTHLAFCDSRCTWPRLPTLSWRLLQERRRRG